MSISRVASRYAKPILEIANQMGVVEEVKDDMDSFLKVCKENRDFTLMIKSPIIPHLKKLQVLEAIFRGKVSELTLKTFQTVTRKNREDLLPEIAEAFVHVYNQAKGIEEVTVTTTYPLDAEERKLFEKLSSEMTGKKPLLTEQVNKNLIGGYQIKFKDKQLDQSVSGKLKNLRLTFLK